MIEHRVAGATGYASRITRDDRTWTDLHLAASPSGDSEWSPVERDPAGQRTVVPALDGRVSRRMLETSRVTPSGPLPLGRIPLVSNEHLTVHHVACRPDETVYANADGDELVCVI